MVGKRDSQRGKVYRSEGVLSKFAKELPTVDDVKKYSDKIMNSSWTKKNFRTTPNVRVKDGRGTCNAFARGNTINIPLWARTDKVVLHELTHVLVPFKPWHGPLFAAGYLKLVKHFMGKEAYLSLKESFKKNKVRTKIRKKRILTPEQKQVLRDRMAKARAARKINLTNAELCGIL